MDVQTDLRAELESLRAECAALALTVRGTQRTVEQALRGREEDATAAVQAREALANVKAEMEQMQQALETLRAERVQLLLTVEQSLQVAIKHRNALQGEIHAALAGGSESLPDVDASPVSEVAGATSTAHVPKTPSANGHGTPTSWAFDA